MITVLAYLENRSRGFFRSWGVRSCWFSFRVAIGTGAFCAALFLWPHDAVAWSSDTTANSAVCTAPDDQNSPYLINDGAGGAILTWRDFRSGSDHDIYAQRVDSTGTVQWTADGVAICAATGEQYGPRLVGDGDGGAIITWMDSRDDDGFDVYAQRVNSAGDVQWTTGGVAICTVSGDQDFPQIVSDGAGGAIITWTDARSGIGEDIYAQRVDSTGTVQWTADGVAICTDDGDQRRPQLASDGAGGAVITWQDSRNGGFDIYAQRVDVLGAVQWTADGVAVSTAPNDQANPQLISDGSGGALISWMDLRNGATWDIYAQRVNSLGAVQWTASGVGICSAIADQYSPRLVTDGANGAIITWYDNRGASLDIYVQRVNSVGETQWASNGVAVCTAGGNQNLPEIVSDGEGGAIFAWYDTNIHVRRVNSFGVAQWAANGVPVCTALASQSLPQLISDGVDQVIVTWQDFRHGNWDIYAQGVNFSGTPLPVSVSRFDVE